MRKKELARVVKRSLNVSLRVFTIFSVFAVVGIIFMGYGALLYFENVPYSEWDVAVHQLYGENNTVEGEIRIDSRLTSDCGILTAGIPIKLHVCATLRICDAYKEEYNNGNITFCFLYENIDDRRKMALEPVPDKSGYHKFIFLTFNGVDQTVCIERIIEFPTSGDYRHYLFNTSYNIRKWGGEIVEGNGEPIERNGAILDISDHYASVQARTNKLIGSFTVIIVGSSFLTLSLIMLQFKSNRRIR